MMIDSDIVVTIIQDHHITPQKLELIFCKVNKHRVNMDFNKFLEAISVLVCEKYPKIYKKSPGRALEKILS